VKEMEKWGLKRKCEELWLRDDLVHSLANGGKFVNKAIRESSEKFFLLSIIVSVLSSRSWPCDKLIRYASSWEIVNRICEWKL